MSKRVVKDAGAAARTTKNLKYKLGRLPARHTVDSIRRKMRLGIALEDLGAPPSASDDFVSAVEKATGGDWEMMGNDRYGDCTCADTAHQVMLRTANASTIVIPTTDEVIALYQAVCPGFDPVTDANDDGADELSVIEYLAKTGWLGMKIDASANIDPAQTDHLKWGVQLCGAVRLGVRLPQSAMDQFDAGEPWDVGGNAKIIGGHDVPIVKYDADGTFWIVTWGKRVAMTPAFFNAYVDEAHMEYSDEWLEASGLAPNGLDRVALLNDLQIESRSYLDRMREGF